MKTYTREELENINVVELAEAALSVIGISIPPNERFAECGAEDCIEVIEFKGLEERLCIELRIPAMRMSGKLGPIKAARDHRQVIIAAILACQTEEPK